MTNYAYEAVDVSGAVSVGTMEVASQGEALRRIREMGLFPTRVIERRAGRTKHLAKETKGLTRFANISIVIPGLSNRVKPRLVAAFTRQLATLVDAGMPLLRGLRILEQQETNPTLKRVIGETSAAIEAGSDLSEALARYPRIFNDLYLNMVKAGELSGALDITLRRLAEFIEKSQKIKGRVKSAMFYPVSVLFVAAGILTLMMTFVVPRFQSVFAGLMDGKPMPAFTLFVLHISELVRHNVLFVAVGFVALFCLLFGALRTRAGRWSFDLFKLKAPVLGPVFRKAAISRFARTLGTLLGNGVPVLQALQIVRATVGNAVVSQVVSSVHSSVKEGGTITMPIKAARVFPPVIAGMVDVGEQTGALPDMLLKVADSCDEEVDNAVGAITSLIEPIMIIFLAVVVGGIVIAMFLPILTIMGADSFGSGAGGDS